MASVLNYINTNSLPCKTYLDATKPANILISGNNFTLINLLGNTNYDFIQSDILLHPTTVPKGITFSNTEQLHFRNSNVLDNIDSYTLINVVSGTDFSNNQLLYASKSDSTIAPALQYSYESSTFQQQHSRLSLYNYLNQNLTYINTIVKSLPYTIQNVVVNHNIKYGISSINTNQSGYVNNINTDKGQFSTGTINQIYLGNNDNGTKPFSNVFKQLLLFVPQIAEVDIQYILSRLLLTQIVWEEIANDDWENIESDMWDDIISDL